MIRESGVDDPDRYGAEVKTEETEMLEDLTAGGGSSAEDSDEVDSDDSEGFAEESSTGAGDGDHGESTDRYRRLW